MWLYCIKIPKPEPEYGNTSQIENYFSCLIYIELLFLSHKYRTTFLFHAGISLENSLPFHSWYSLLRLHGRKSRSCHQCHRSLQNGGLKKRNTKLKQPLHLLWQGLHNLSLIFYTKGSFCDIFTKTLTRWCNIHNA